MARPPPAERGGAGGADEILDAGIGEHVGQFLFRHPLRLDAEEPVEQPLDVGVGAWRRDSDSRAGAAACVPCPSAGAGTNSRSAPPVRRRARSSAAGNHWRRADAATAPSGSAGRASAAVAGTAPAHRLRRAPRSPAIKPSRSAGVGAGGEFAVPQRHVEGGVLAAHEACDLTPCSWLSASGSSSSGRCSASAAITMKGRRPSRVPTWRCQARGNRSADRGCGDCCGCFEARARSPRPGRDRPTMSTLAMRLGFDHVGASAVRLSIAAAMVIADTC